MLNIFIACKERICFSTCMLRIVVVKNCVGYLILGSVQACSKRIQDNCFLILISFSRL